MIPNEQLLKKAQAAIEAEQRINIRSFPLHLELQDSRLVLDGDVESIAVKRLVVRLAERIDGIHGVVDRLHVVSSELRADGEIANSLTQLLQGQIDLKNCAIRHRVGSRIESLRDPIHEDRSGEITYSVVDGVVILEGHVISLTHQRIAEVLSWWVPGSRNVVNQLMVIPTEHDSDDEVSDAVHLALEMDPLLAHADQIGVSTNHGVVTLDGAIASTEEKQLAEFDTWCIRGVGDVENRLEVIQ